MRVRGRLAAVVLAGAGIMAAGGASLATRETPAGLRTALARQGTLELTVTEAGTLRAASSATHRSPIEGRELEITWLAPEGAEVREGEVVATVDASELRLELDRVLQSARQVETELAAANVDREEAALALRGVVEGAGLLTVEEGRTELKLLQGRAKRFREEHQRLEPLLAKGYVTREEFDRAGLEADEAEARAALGERAFRILAERTYPANVQAARLQLARREAQIANLRPKLESIRAFAATLASQISRCSIRAAHPGLVTYDENLSVNPRRKIRVGDRVTPSQGIVTLPDLRGMVVDAAVRESDVRTIAPGQRVHITLDAFPDTPLQGTVSRVGALARDPSRGNETRFAVTIDLPPSNLPVRPAMNARVDIVVAELHDVVLAPLEAVSGSDATTVVYVIRGSTIERRVVQTGRSNATDIEIVSGVSAGERVSLQVPAGDGRH